MRIRKLYYTYKQWKNLHDPVKQKLCEDYEIIITGKLPMTTKEKVVKAIDMVDITRPEGAKNLDKTMDKITKGFNKMDSIFNELDTALAKIGGDSSTKSLLDDPVGKDNMGFGKKFGKALKETKKGLSEFDREISGTKSRKGLFDDKPKRVKSTHRVGGIPCHVDSRGNVIVDTKRLGRSKMKPKPKKAGGINILGREF